MKLDEVTPVLDVHPPHETPHGWRDFLIHIFTITVGLVIALSLEGILEWHHHRELVRDAEASLHAEIKKNAAGTSHTLSDLHKEQASLKADITVLKYIEKNHKAPADSSLDVTFHIRTFDSVAWRTAQSTGALSYMPYDRAQEFSDIYLEQDELKSSEEQAARDAIISLGPLMDAADNEDPTEGEAASVRKSIEVLQGQLLLVDSFLAGLDQKYKKFLAEYRN
jgi:hypothetical protein